MLNHTRGKKYGGNAQYVDMSGKLLLVQDLLEINAHNVIQRWKIRIYRSGCFVNCSYAMKIEEENELAEAKANKGNVWR